MDVVIHSVGSLQFSPYTSQQWRLPGAAAGEAIVAHLGRYGYVNECNLPSRLDMLTGRGPTRNSILSFQNTLPSTSNFTYANHPSCLH